MKKISTFALLILCAGLFSACAIVPVKEKQGIAPTNNARSDKSGNQSVELLTVDEEGYSKFDNTLLEQAISGKGSTQLSEAEAQGLKFMIEEEKLARDIYAKFFEKWSQSIFDNISSSEHTHISAVRAVADKYGLDTAFYNNKLGEFTNTHLKELYVNMLDQGSTSTLAALEVGALIEEIDIADLDKYISETSNKDLKLVYENLQKGSRNHLRSFVKNILRREGTYEAQKLSSEVFDRIVNSPIEKGSVD